MAQYKLYYFNLRGRAEVIRYVLAAAGQEYEDVRFEKEEWASKYKAQSPTGQSPFLEIKEGNNTTTLCQSIAIARYLARKFGLAGKGELEQAEVEMYADQVTDLLNAYAKARFEPDDARKAEFLKKLTEETVPAQLAIFEKRLASTGTGSIAVSGLTYADFYLALIYESVADAGVDAAERDAALAKYPNLKKLIQNVNTHPKIAAWIAKRPVTHM